MNPVTERFSEVVDAIRCPDCFGTGAEDLTTPGNGACSSCNGSGINTEVLDEASGWGTWAISVHDRPGMIVVVPLNGKSQ